ncbi:MAG TPA: SMP-30/gluconolactonase/LRE family protein [Chitinispirillaceae bacterium]|nr:SMP-30/gluconolactonase/LRE family protein [Chitinispirillaceae bacterium]
MGTVLKKVCFTGNALICLVLPIISHTITLPENLIAKNAQVNTVTSNVTFGEGPAVDPSGNLFFTDRTPSRIWKVTSDGNASVYKNPADDANGMVFDSEGRLIVCIRDGLIRVEKDSTTTVLLKADSLKYSNNEGPNDLTLTSKDGIFFTSSEWSKSGRVFYRSPDGNVKTILSFKAPPTAYPNGLEYIEEKHLLYLCLTQCDSVLKYKVNDDMSVTRIGMVCNVKSPDGLAIDNNGNLWIATNEGSPGVTVFDSLGNKLGSIAISNQQSVQNCAFGGSGNKTLYITAKTAVYSVVTVIGGRSTTGVVTSVSGKNKNNRTNQSALLQSSLAKNSIQIWSIDGRCLSEHAMDFFSKDLTDEVRINSFVKSSFPAGVYIVKFFSDGIVQRKIVATF